MRASPAIVGEVAGQDAAHVAFAEDQNVIQTLAPDRADEPRHRLLVDGELVAQGQVLDGELAMAAEEREESEQVEQERDHRAEILAGSAPADQRLGTGRGFGEGHPRPATSILPAHSRSAGRADRRRRDGAQTGRPRLAAAYH